MYPLLQFDFDICIFMMQHLLKLEYRVTHLLDENLQLLRFEMFRHPAWAVGSYSSGPPAAKTVGTNVNDRF